jgi:hypothetical protein
MKKIINFVKTRPVECIITIGIFIFIIVILTGCREADRASYNLSKEADNFNIVRQLTVMNCIQGDVLFQMTGCMSIYVDSTDNQLEVTVKNENGTYAKHFVGLSDNVTYVVEDLDLGSNDVSTYRYTLKYNPKMWLPVDIEEEKE